MITTTLKLWRDTSIAKLVERITHASSNSKLCIDVVLMLLLTKIDTSVKDVEISMAFDMCLALLNLIEKFLPQNNCVPHAICNTDV